MNIFVASAIVVLLQFLIYTIFIHNPDDLWQEELAYFSVEGALITFAFLGVIVHLHLCDILDGKISSRIFAFFCQFAAIILQPCWTAVLVYLLLRL